MYAPGLDPPVSPAPPGVLPLLGLAASRLWPGWVLPLARLPPVPAERGLATPVSCARLHAAPAEPTPPAGFDAPFAGTCPRRPPCRWVGWVTCDVQGKARICEQGSGQGSSTGCACGCAVFACVWGDLTPSGVACCAVCRTCCATRTCWRTSWATSTCACVGAVVLFVEGAWVMVSLEWCSAWLTRVYHLW